MIGLLDGILRRVARIRNERRLSVLKTAGLTVADDVSLPASTWIDDAHCYLIAIESGCTFGEECLLLAHDAQMDEFLDAARLGRVTIREGSHIGHRTTVLPGVEIGPRTVVLPNSVVMKSLPPETVCAGNPAKVVSTLEEYIAQRKADRLEVPTLDEADLAARSRTPRGRAELSQTLARGGYLRRSS